MKKCTFAKCKKSDRFGGLTKGKLYKVIDGLNGYSFRVINDYDSEVPALKSGFSVPLTLYINE